MIYMGAVFIQKHKQKASETMYVCQGFAKGRYELDHEIAKM